MPVMLERSSDDKMDGLAAKVDRVDRELREHRSDLREMRKELREERKATKEGFETLNRTLSQTAVGLSTGFVIGWGALVGLIATQL